MWDVFFFSNFPWKPISPQEMKIEFDRSHLPTPIHVLVLMHPSLSNVSEFGLRFYSIVAISFRLHTNGSKPWRNKLSLRKGKPIDFQVSPETAAIDYIFVPLVKCWMFQCIRTENSIKSTKTKKRKEKSNSRKNTHHQRHRHPFQDGSIFSLLYYGSACVCVCSFRMFAFGFIVRNVANHNLWLYSRFKHHLNIS